MNRSTNFFVGLGAALTMFGILTLALGPRQTHWNNHRIGFSTHHSEYRTNCDIPQRNETDSTNSH